PQNNFPSILLKAGWEKLERQLFQIFPLQTSIFANNLPPPRHKVLDQAGKSKDVMLLLRPPGEK
ncbi:MAG: hypothetical protein R6V56_06610, partial [Lentisphaeria bacterium]